MAAQLTSSRRILIVENDPIVTSAVEVAGSHFNLEADRASDGWDAIQKLETNVYEAVVVDLTLPRWSGFGVIQYLREENESLDRVFCLTDGDDSRVREKIGDERCRVINRSDAGLALEDAFRASGIIRDHA